MEEQFMKKRSEMLKRKDNEKIDKEELIDDKNEAKEKKKIGYDSSARRHIWEVKEADWLET